MQPNDVRTTHETNETVVAGACKEVVLRERFFTGPSRRMVGMLHEHDPDMTRQPHVVQW